MSSQLITYNGDNRASFGIIRDGVKGNRDIALQMVDITRNSSAMDKGLEDFAKGAGKNNLFGVRGFSARIPVLDVFETVYQFVADNVRYAPDVNGHIESIKSARQTLADGYGDCDDHAILVATLLAILGYDPYFVMANYTQGGNFEHIYTAINHKGKRYVFDTTLDGGKLNDEGKARHTENIGVFDYLPELDGIKGLFFQLKSAGRALKKDTSATLPAILGALPTGFGYAASTLLGTGAELVSGGAQKTQSVNEIGTAINAELVDIINQLYRSQIALDHAKVLARQAGMRLGLAEPTDLHYGTVYKSVKDKIQFIENFETVAQKENISTAYLDGKLMLVAGAAILGASAYYFVNKKRAMALLQGW